MLQQKKLPKPHQQALMEKYGFVVFRFSVYNIDITSLFLKP